MIKNDLKYCQPFLTINELSKNLETILFYQNFIYAY